MSTDKVDHVLVRRLMKCYSWWKTSFYHKITRTKLLEYAPREDYLDEKDDRRWDNLEWNCGRVRHFYDLFSQGKKVTPITLDNHCSAGYIYPEVVLVDGHHRLAGAIFAGVKKIPSSYSGRTDLLRYLKGRRKTIPQY